MPSSDITTNFVVVEPASIPKKQFPLNVLKSALLTLSFSWRFLNSSYSASIEKSGFNGLEVSSWDDFKTSILLFSFSIVIVCELRESKAAPLATNKWASFGTIISLSFKFSVSINLFLSSDK